MMELGISGAYGTVGVALGADDEGAPLPKTETVEGEESVLELGMLSALFEVKLPVTVAEVGFELLEDPPAPLDGQLAPLA